MTRLACRWLFVLAAALLLLTSCDEPAVRADSEVAAELRALRAMLAQQPKLLATAPSGSGTATAVDRTQIAAALQPLREVLDGLLTEQRQLQAQQSTLTQEMQRWSQLLVENVTGTRRDEGLALAKRLQQIETTLKEQDVRHREVEGLLQSALDRTADRLGDFLRRLDGANPDAAPVAPEKALSNWTSLVQLNVDFGTLAVGLGSFPLGHGP